MWHHESSRRQEVLSGRTLSAALPFLTPRGFWGLTVLTPRELTHSLLLLLEIPCRETTVPASARICMDRCLGLFLLNYGVASSHTCLEVSLGYIFSSRIVGRVLTCISPSPVRFYTAKQVLHCPGGDVLMYAWWSLFSYMQWPDSGT